MKACVRPIWHCRDSSRDCLEPGLLCSCLGHTTGQAETLSSLPGRALDGSGSVSHRCSSLDSPEALGRSLDTAEPESLPSCLAHAISQWLARLAVQKGSAEAQSTLKQGAEGAHAAGLAEPGIQPQLLHHPQPACMEPPVWSLGRALLPLEPDSGVS